MNNFEQSDHNEVVNNSDSSNSKTTSSSLVPTNQKAEPLTFETNSNSGYEDPYSEGDYYGAANQQSQGQMLRGVFASLRKHWFLILSITFIATATTIIYVAQKPDYYKATLRIQVNVETNPADGAAKSVIVNNPTYDPVHFTTQLQIIESAGLLRRVAKTIDLENNKNFLDPQHGKQLTVFQNVKKMFGFYRLPPPENSTKDNGPNQNNLILKNEKLLNNDAETEKYSPLVARIKSSMTVLPVRDSRMGNRETRLIEVEYTHQDPQVAAKIVNAIGDTYVLQNLEQKVQTNASAGDFLLKRVAELQTDIRLGEERLVNYSKNNQLVPLNGDQNTVVQRFGDLNLKLGQAENDRISAQTVYQSTLQNQMRAATAERSDSQVVGLETKLNELRQKLAQLKLEYTDEWYEVGETKKQIESVENQLQLHRKRASDIQLASLSEKLNEAIAREKELRNSVDQQRAEVIRQNEASINYKIIQQEIDTNKSLLAGLLQRSRENDVILNGTPNNVLVSDRAVTPTGPVGPERGKSVLLAFVISLFAGGGLAFLIEWLNDSIHNSNDIETNLGLPLLAAIPSAPMSLSQRLLPGNLSLKNSKKYRSSAYNLSAFDKPEFSETYLQLRTYLMLSTPGGSPKIILVTSGEESEGKTTTALNLAKSLANTGEPILLIDADLRCPRIHLLKDLSNNKGLTTLLTAETLDKEMVDESIQKNGEGDLYVLTAGERTPNPANLLGSERMRTLLEVLSARYTYIIIDSPPVLYFADSAILSTMVKAVILVVRDNVSSRQVILKAKKMLLNVGANVVGMVMNGISMERTHYKYKNYEMEPEIPTGNEYSYLNLHNKP